MSLSTTEINDIILAGTRAFDALPENTYTPEQRERLLHIAGAIIQNEPREYDDMPEAAAYQALRLNKIFVITLRDQSIDDSKPQEAWPEGYETAFVKSTHSQGSSN